MRVAIYVRVSTDKQTTTNQTRVLRKWAKNAGHEIVATFDDSGVSGAKGREGRVQFDAMLKAAVRREFDMVAAWSVDRLGRSLKDLVAFLEELQGSSVDLFLHQQALDTSTPSGKALFGMLGVFSEFERAMIQERVKAGLERAKASGKVLGRPRTSTRVEAAIRKHRKTGMGIRKIASELGIGVSVVQRVISV
ncbi:MAG TPA: recombinase family protein [Chromatiaceae bacterium]|jgi:DNA invertase Pin-like site-specific DNA recombinase|nr:recombinase family protein [Chromatiaceae bacterium]